MKNIKLFLLFVLCQIFVACNSHDTDCVEADNVEYNQQTVERLQNKYGVKVEVEFAPNYTQRMSKKDVESLEDYFKFIAGLKKNPLKLNQSSKTLLTRNPTDTKNFTQTLNYEGDNVYVYVYYEMNTTGGLVDNPSIEVGMGGAGNPFAHYAGNSCHENACYEVIYWDSKKTYTNTRIDVERIRADYVLRYYSFENGHLSDTPYATVKTKLSAYGYVNILNETGEFHLIYSGDGSWMRTIIDEEFNEGLNQ